ERLVGAQPRLLATPLRETAERGPFVEEMVRRLPAVAAAAAVDHHEHLAGVAVALHFDEVIPAADAAELAYHARIRALDRREVNVVGHRDVLALAELLAHVERLGAVAQDL